MTESTSRPKEKLSVRLRKAYEKQGYSIVHCLDDVFDTNTFDNDAAALFDAIAKLEARAEATEETYLKLPVDENGKPWKIGDMCDFGDWFSKGDRVHEIYGLHYYYDGEWRIQPLNCEISFRVDNCTRPPAPVLDADGVELKVGEVPYGKYTGTKRSAIKSVHHSGEKTPSGSEGRTEFVIYENGEWDFANNVIHKAPDSWDKLIHDMEADDTRTEWGHDFVGRIKALRERDA